MPKKKTFDCADLVFALANLLANESCDASGVPHVPDGRVAMNDGEERPTGFSFELEEDGRVFAVQVTEVRGESRRGSVGW